jgi:hypothetical protein
MYLEVSTVNNMWYWLCLENNRSLIYQKVTGIVPKGNGLYCRIIAKWYLVHFFVAKNVEQSLMEIFV